MQSQGQWKWDQIVVSGAYKHGRYENTLLKSPCVMSKVKDFARLNKTG